MPGKSRRRQGKYSPQSKQRKGRSSPPPVRAQSPAVAQADEPVFASNLQAPAKSVPAPKAEAAAVSYPYIAAELRTIAILSAIMLLVLVVLAWVLA